MLPQLLLATLALPLAMADGTFSNAGCYSLSSLKSYLTSQGDYTYQTNSYCQQLCSDAGYSVAGTLDGSTCYCGSKLPSDIEDAESIKCDSTCNGYGTEICGGDGYLTISTDGEEDTSPAGDSSSSAATSSSTTGSSTQASSSTAQSTTSASSSTQASTSSSSPSTSVSSTSASTTKTSSTSDHQTTAVITSIITASNSVQTTTQVMTASTSSPSSTGTSTSKSSDSSSSSGLSKGAIAGIAVGAVVGVLLLFAIFIFFFIRSRRNDDDDEDHYSEKHLSPPPVHNDMSPSHGGNGGVYNYGAGFGSEDAFQSVPPVPFYVSENGRKRLSNGSLPDARHEKTLRVTNPDETMNDTTLHDVDQSYSDDEDSFEKFRS